MQEDGSQCVEGMITWCCLCYWCLCM